MTYKENITAILECYFTGYKEEIIESACNRIVELEPKTGHWIDTGSGQECSECGEIQYGYDSYRCFCANCGAKMVEPKEHEDKRMKKVFISQPMNGLTDLQIEKDRARVIECLHNLGYTSNKITIIDTYIEENAPDNVNSGLWYLGKSLELLADADIAVFAKGWRNARGCLIEFECATEYGISCIYED